MWWIILLLLPLFLLLPGGGNGKGYKANNADQQQAQEKRVKKIDVPNFPMPALPSTAPVSNSPTQVPTPALLPGLMMLGFKAMRHRQAPSKTVGEE